MERAPSAHALPAHPMQIGTSVSWTNACQPRCIGPDRSQGKVRAVSVLEVEGLRKEYRRLRGGLTLAVAGLDLEVPEGGVFGFLGPNGAGKTTTIRCLLGLVRPSAGSLRVLGAEVPGGLAGVIERVGSIVEQPALFPRFSGRRNLEILGRLHRVPAAPLDRALERVGLTDRQHDPVRRYSLGMKQRLAIAATLLRDPAVLILDEPANGLDPVGIVEVRELLRSLGAEGRTVFVSSHILSEVQQVADRVAILARGRCVATGPVHDVLGSGRGRGLVARLDDLDAGRVALADAGIAAERDEDHLRVDLPADAGATVTRALADRGLYLTELRADELDLERVFLEITRDPDADGSIGGGA
jgi:ABC-2 type transport system ATP-binding protein